MLAHICNGTSPLSPQIFDQVHLSAENYTAQLRHSWGFGGMLCHGPRRKSQGYHGLQDYWRRRLAETSHNNCVPAVLSRQSWSEIVTGSGGRYEEVNKTNYHSLETHLPCHPPPPHTTTTPCWKPPEKNNPGWRIKEPKLAGILE